MNINWDKVFSAWAQIIETALIIGGMLLFILLGVSLIFGVGSMIVKRIEK